jgi:2-dehydro-3-deoxygluconokinase
MGPKMTTATPDQPDGRKDLWDLVTVGEAMALFMGSPAAPLRPGSQVTFSFAGAESNVAIGASRLGHRVAYVSRIGDDHMGRTILGTLASEGVDVGGVHRDDQAPTSLMVRQHRTADLITVDYYRREGAGRRLSPGDIDPKIIEGSRLLHLSGITPSLSETACEATLYAASVAVGAGVPVSLDINHRAQMWSEDEAGRALRKLLPSVDILFGSPAELLLVEQADSAEEAAQRLRERGIGQVVLKRGSQGASLWHAGGRVDLPAIPVTAVDPVGAGDAFVAGYLSAFLDQTGTEDRLRRAVSCGAFAVSVHGDWEGTPHRDELELIGLKEQVQR